jgi:hypothetical protein
MGPKEGPTPSQAGRLTVGRYIIVTFTRRAVRELTTVVGEGS